jgi:hypothetical protein
MGLRWIAWVELGVCAGANLLSSSRRLGYLGHLDVFLPIRLVDTCLCILCGFLRIEKRVARRNMAR